MRTTRTALVMAIALVGSSFVQAPAGATHGRIQSLSSAAVGADDPFVGLDRAGTATAVWTDRLGVHVRIRPKGGQFGFDRLISNTSRADVVAFDQLPNGNAIVAWTYTGDGRIRVSVRLGQNALFSPPVAVGGDGTSANAPHAPHVAISSSGRAVVGWTEGNSPVKVRVAVANTNGRFGRATTLANSTGLNFPQVGIDAVGSVLAVWADSTAERALVVGATAPAGGTFSASRTIANSRFSVDPKLAVNAGGDAVLAYIPNEETGTVDVAVRYGTVQGDFGELVPLDGNGEGVGDHDVAIDDGGKAAVLYSFSAGPDFDLRAKVSTAGGDFSGAHQVLTEAEAAAGPGIGDDNMEIAAGGAEFSAFWATDEGGDGENESYQASSSGGTFGARHRVSPASTTDSATETHGARNPAGDVVATWALFTDNLRAQASPTTRDDARPDINRISDGPDPFNPRRATATIRFKPSEEVRATVRILNASGRTIRTLLRRELLLGKRFAAVKWNGRNGGGDIVGSGRYRYRIQVEDPAGNTRTETRPITVTS